MPGRGHDTASARAEPATAQNLLLKPAVFERVASQTTRRRHSVFCIGSAMIDVAARPAGASWRRGAIAAAEDDLSTGRRLLFSMYFPTSVLK